MKKSKKLGETIFNHIGFNWHPIHNQFNFKTAGLIQDRTIRQTHPLITNIRIITLRELNKQFNVMTDVNVMTNIW